MRRIVRNLLKEKAGSPDADEAEDGVAVLQKAAQWQFDFVTDINMPNMNGFQLLAEIKDDKLKQMPRAGWSPLKRARKTIVLQPRAVRGGLYRQAFPKATLEEKVTLIF